MSIDEILADLTQRCEDAEAFLRASQEHRERTGNADDARRLSGKREGVALVRDWLRSYGGAA